MRQGQQNRRGRGRNNNNGGGGGGHHQGSRKGQNPLGRSYESNGPDVKLRGTPAHIAEKYLSLARDAQSSGDPVLAENYLQHAEHYNRIIMAYREQQIAQGGGDPGGGMPRGRMPMSGEPIGGDDFGDDDGSDMPVDALGNAIGGMGEQPPMPIAPRYEGRPNREHQQQRGEHGRPPFRDRGDRDRDRSQGGNPGEPRHERRHERGEHQPRFDRPDRGERGDRGDRPERADRVDRPERVERPERAERDEMRAAPQESPTAEPREHRRRERFQPSPALQHDQPEFLRRPIRRPRRDEAGETAAPAAPAAAVDETD